MNNPTNGIANATIEDAMTSFDKIVSWLPNVTLSLRTEVLVIDSLSNRGKSKESSSNLSWEIGKHTASQNHKS